MIRYVRIKRSQSLLITLGDIISLQIKKYLQAHSSIRIQKTFKALCILSRLHRLSGSVRILCADTCFYIWQKWLQSGLHIYSQSYSRPASITEEETSWCVVVTLLCISVRDYSSAQLHHRLFDSKTLKTPVLPRCVPMHL